MKTVTVEIPGQLAKNLVVILKNMRERTSDKRKWDAGPFGVLYSLIYQKLPKSKKGPSGRKLIERTVRSERRDKEG